MTLYAFLAPRHLYSDGSGSWSRRVDVGGTPYVVGVERGKRVRIAYKPRGRNIGYKWYGFVRDGKGHEIWSGLVTKSLGVNGVLKLAGLIS